MKRFVSFAAKLWRCEFKVVLLWLDVSFWSLMCLFLCKVCIL